MYSMSYLYQALGNNSDADRAELIAFNALPAQMSPNWWARQYVGQPNQGYSRKLDEHPFWNLGPYGQIYGVDSNYPCCTVNHPQGLPKFLSNSFVRFGDNDIAHVLLSPGSLTATLASGQMHVQCSTDYPFSDTLHYTITTASASTFHVRVPTWADVYASTLSVNTTAHTLSPNPSTGLHAVLLPAGTSTLTYTLAAHLTTHPRANDTLSVQRGALVFALSIPSTNTSHPANKYNDADADIPDAPPLAVDWQLNNASAWNVAIDPSTFVFRSALDNATLRSPLFAPGAPPVWVEARGCEIGAWGVYRGVLDVPPPRAERACVGEVGTYRLEPVGAAKLRLLDVPVIDLAGNAV